MPVHTCVHNYAHVQLLLFNLFLIAVANAYEEGEEVVVWSSGWSPEAVRVLATSSGSGMLGSWKVVMDGDFNDVPVSSLWSHRCVLHLFLSVFLERLLRFPDLKGQGV